MTEQLRQAWFHRSKDDIEVVSFHLFYANRTGEARALVERNTGELVDVSALLLDFIVADPPIVEVKAYGIITAEQREEVRKIVRETVEGSLRGS
jgi:hypothetical protein